MGLLSKFSEPGFTQRVLRDFPRHFGRAFNLIRHFFVLRSPTRPLRLHLGCGKRRFEGFVNIDVNYNSATDYVCDVSRLPCPDNSVERIENYHVIEHIPRNRVKETLAEWLRVLRPGGTLVIECPDLDEAMRQYLAGNKERLFSVYGHQRFPGDAHHWGYTDTTLSELLASVGFHNILQLAPQDYHKDIEPCIRVECQKP